MTLGWSEHPEATDELLTAIRHYHQQRPGLGNDLDTEIAAAIHDICEWPHSWPPLPGWDQQPTVRTRQVAIFPYRIVYFMHDTEVVILAYAHTSREPGYWKHRLEN